MRFAGKTVVITGAARGIGAAIATRFAAEGGRVAIADLDAEAAEKLALQLGRDDQPCAGFALDVADLDSIASLVNDVVDRLGPIDVLVNNAGVDTIERFLDSKPETWDRLLSVNLKGTIAMCHAVVPGMVERRTGRVVNIASDAGRVGSSGEVVYSGTKGGVIAFSKALAREVARDSITVNVVCPGPTDTALLGQVAAASQKLYDSIARSVPLRRIAVPDDIAPAVAFFASDDAAYITGQTLSVSGGLTMA
ncbi:MAG: 2-hydroxycyclohexanecarboxyl-CoA dehydrogenase [Actinomycetota bacterium]|nr:2-hydroxycyclohexanecarboxyl-CoA dehydrogenase [Actinomycetota bacterium]